jgi:hypothetical protein
MVVGKKCQSWKLRDFRKKIEIRKNGILTQNSVFSDTAEGSIMGLKSQEQLSGRPVIYRPSISGGGNVCGSPAFSLLTPWADPIEK